MGRKKKRVKKLLLNSFYVVDRRIPSFIVYRTIISRQNSRNKNLENNTVIFEVCPAPALTTLLVVAHLVMFGKDYAKVIASSKTGKVVIGYILLVELKRIVKGRLKWEEIKEE